MGITFRNGVDEMGINTVDEMGIDEMGSYRDTASYLARVSYARSRTFEPWQSNTEDFYELYQLLLRPDE